MILCDVDCCTGDAVGQTVLMCDGGGDCTHDGAPEHTHPVFFCAVHTPA